ncbi:TPA: hypothetical protein NJ393_000260 [Vibrio parahaemolyticus]|uniref:hypothetical protein n=1 Tax=Vibrio parahaemolyticus TaxID=670 RepID=UPI002330DA19|nr:hypothetical protein [Vibrio parahaemolyticus]MDB6192285.1 hypothetical protein [Vibrio parahaemolyticus]HCG7374412.1 hypothetical protein [Vibrio parahaemolyticus]
MNIQQVLKQLNTLQELNKFSNDENIYEILEEYEIKKAHKQMNDDVKTLEKSLESKFNGVEYLEPEHNHSQGVKDYSPTVEEDSDTRALLKSLEDKYNGQEYL